MVNDTQVRICKIDGCDGLVKTRGWCNAHYMRWWMKGDPGPADIVRRPKGRVCSVDGCTRKHEGRGYCGSHLWRVNKYGDPGPTEIEPRRPGAKCSIEGCDNPHRARDLCDKHLQRLKKKGDPLAPLLENNWNWTGDDASYDAVHQRLRKQRGRAADFACVMCGGKAADWSYEYTDPDARRDAERGLYSVNPDCYRPRCKSCHKLFDLAHGQQT